MKLSGLLVIAVLLAALVGATLVQSATDRSKDASVANVATAADAAIPTSRGKAEGPKPDATSLAQLTAIIGHYGGKTPEPQFAGEMNGFTFRRNSAPSFAACAGMKPFGDAADFEAPLVNDSGLGFTAAFMPSDFSVQIIHPMSSQNSGPVAVSRCGESVVSVTARWTSADKEIAITRQSTLPVISDRFSKDRIEATTISGRPAIVIHPRFDGETVFVYLRDNSSFWTIGGEGISLTTLLQVAQNLK